MKSSIQHIRQFLRSKAGATIALLFLGFIFWRAVLAIFFSSISNSNYSIQLWGSSYQLLALWGVICGLAFSGMWGGWKSSVGRANILFALGLCAQLFGQSVSSYYVYKGSSLPYPSLADLGFFLTIPFYTYGALLLAKVGGAKITARSFFSKVQIVVIPLIMLGISFFVFLKGYQFDWSHPLTIFLDFGYPLGDAVYISAAILAFSLSLRMLGGIMRPPILLFIGALVMQYIADFTFLYQNYNGGFVVGGITDTMYVLSYFLMAVSLINLAVVFKKIKSS